MRYYKLILISLTLVLCLWTAGLRWELSKSDWAAWVQAIGSIGAILAAVLIVGLQHKNEQRRIAEASRLERRARLNALRALLMYIAEGSSRCASRVDRPHVTWDIEAEQLAESKALIQSIPIFSIPDEALVLRFTELASSLQIAKTMALQMNFNKSAAIRQKIAEIIGRSSTIARHGISDVSALLVACSTNAELEKSWTSYENRKKNEDIADDIWNSEQAKKSPITSESPEK